MAKQPNLERTSLLVAHVFAVSNLISVPSRSHPSRLGRQKQVGSAVIQPRLAKSGFYHGGYRANLIKRSFPTNFRGPIPLVAIPALVAPFSAHEKEEIGCPDP
ncbi:hypothetical protein LX32DRAFT_636172 [Colletotrichum zoysiae]|uniref:Uncharacterized protein n=1 Tax=Colletotrichum zoysiae TaxID=1216348 RepID=A0AAD9HP63_9PEZI|nr:hypothetical protein LX32DRAFT_636172 [Colletotrichum zoysiae]